MTKAKTQLIKHHEKNPANQPFQLAGKKNLTKKKAWWQLGNNNNPKAKKQKQADKKGEQV